ncbi:MAG: hypothetical protein AAB737_04535, partial [Patescibacteria group bacterium]
GNLELASQHVLHFGYAVDRTIRKQAVNGIHGTEINFFDIWFVVYALAGDAEKFCLSGNGYILMGRNNQLFPFIMCP